MNDMIMNEIARSGEVSPITPSLLQLDEFRIMSDTQVPKEEFLLRLFGKPCFPRRDLTAITGMEKCGKTFFTSMLMACCARQRVLGLERIGDSAFKVLWYDTEQSPGSTKSILTERVFRLIQTDGTEDSHIFAFNVRSCNCEQRMDYLIAGIEAYKPDLVIVDNVTDLLANINDAEQSVKVISQLMQMAMAHDCNISVVIHLNRSGEKRSLRGWLGTEILHKAFEVYCCENIENTDVFSVEQLFTRKYHIDETLYYTISDEGLPTQATKPQVQPRDSNGRYATKKAEPYQVSPEKVDTFNQDYIIRHDDGERISWEWNLRRLFGDAMGDRAQMSPEDLKKAVMALSWILQSRYYDKVFRLANEQRVIRTTMDRSGRIVVIPLPS